MLIYNPAFDIYHCIFRILTALSILPKKEYRVEVIRMIDFFILFPYLFSEIGLPRNYKKLQNSLKALKSNYNDIPNLKRLYMDIYSLQLQSLNSLSSMEIIDKTKMEDNLIIRTNTKLPGKLSTIIREGSSQHPNITEMILALGDIPLNGPKGLKARSGLMEYRYDVA